MLASRALSKITFLQALVEMAPAFFRFPGGNNLVSAHVPFPETLLEIDEHTGGTLQPLISILSGSHGALFRCLGSNCGLPLAVEPNCRFSA